MGVVGFRIRGLVFFWGCWVAEQKAKSERPL